MHKIILRVSCAILRDNEKIMVAQRSEKMHLPLKWEFPGGKISKNENGKDAILREIKEELALDIEVLEILNISRFEEENRIIELYPFICKIISGKPELLEHKDIKWDLPENILNIDMAPADIPVLKDYISRHFTNESNKKSV